MAYFRNSSIDNKLLKQSNNSLNHSEIKNSDDVYDEKNVNHNDIKNKKTDEYEGQKPLIIFTLNISFLSPFLRYLVLGCGLFFFMCFYGYFQELVVYGWFNRKLSLFCTFLHFLGCSFFAHLQYKYSQKNNILGITLSSPLSSSNSKIKSLPPLINNRIIKEKIIKNYNFFGWFLDYFRLVYCYLQNTILSMGTAPPKVALGMSCIYISYISDVMMLCIYVCIYICIYMFVCVCMYAYIYI
jgi:hypothetical protein